MKVYVRAPYPENRLAELREMFAITRMKCSKTC